MNENLTARLGDLVSVINGLWTGKKAPYQTVKVIRNTNFTKNCRLDLSDVAVLEVEMRQFESRQLVKGDLILEKSGGGPKQAVGRVVLFYLEDSNYSFSNFTSVLRVNDAEIINPVYLQKFLYMQYLLGITEEMQSNSTGIRNLNMSLFLDILVPVPTMDYQLQSLVRLNQVFLQIDEIQSNLQKSNVVIGSLIKSVLQSEFSPR